MQNGAFATYSGTRPNKSPALPRAHVSALSPCPHQMEGRWKSSSMPDPGGVMKIHEEIKKTKREIIEIFKKFIVLNF